MKAITEDPKESQALRGERSADANNTSDALRDLSNKIPAKKANKGELTDVADNMLTIVEVLGSSGDKKVDKKEALLGAVIGLMAHYLKPKIKEEKKDDESSKGKSAQQEKKVKKELLATIPPMATPAQIQEVIKTNFKNLGQLYENYKITKNPKELKYFLTLAITAKESGVGTDNKLRLRLVNQAAVGPPKRKFLLEQWGIKVPPLPGSSSKLVTQECLASFSQFKERVCSQLQPDVTDSVKRVDNTAEILARCAIGKYQILPIYHIPGMQKQGNGEEKLLKIYQFITSDESQTKSVEKIIEGLGNRYDWNPQSVMVAYYAGTKWADKLSTDKNNPAFNAKQYGGHGSIKEYAERTAKLADDAIAKANSGA